jgi:hypothetical protein
LQPWFSLLPSLLRSLRRPITSVYLPGLRLRLLPKGLLTLLTLPSLTRRDWMRSFAIYVNPPVLSKVGQDVVLVLVVVG